jgi:hypothetical protein
MMSSPLSPGVGGREIGGAGLVALFDVLLLPAHHREREPR